jgi:hypothetical protein
MDYRSSTSRYILTALAIILVVTSFILVGLNALNLQQRLQVPSLTSTGGQDTQAAYVSGYLAARKKYQNLCPITAQAQMGFAGTVQAISGTGLKVKAENLDTDLTVDGVDDVRVVSLAANATIQKSVQKTEAQLATELKADHNTPPLAVTLTSMRLADIKLGDRVFVSSLSDVRLVQTIVASSIIVQ